MIDKASFELAGWRKSSRSTTNSSCVEVAVTPQVVGVRDTKDRDGGALVFSRPLWAAFTAKIKSEPHAMIDSCVFGAICWLDAEKNWLAQRDPLSVFQGNKFR